MAAGGILVVVIRMERVLARVEKTPSSCVGHIYRNSITLIVSHVFQHVHVDGFIQQLQNEKEVTSITPL